MLAFDRERVRRLHDAVVDCVDVLLRLQTDDPLAIHAELAVSAARSALLDWATRLRVIAASTVMEDDVRTGASGLSRARIEARIIAAAGWDASFATAGDLDTDDVTTLVGRLDDDEIGHVVLLAAMSDDDVDSIVDALAAALGPARTDACGRLDAVLAGLRPEAAVIVLGRIARSAHPLTPAALADLAIEVLSRWLHRHDTTAPAGHEEAWVVAWPAADLMAALAASAEASRAFMAAALDHPDGLQLLTDTIDPVSGTAVVLAATNPATTPVAVAGTIIRPVITFVLGSAAVPGLAFDDRWAAGLGPVVAPWLPQMTSRAADWGWGEAEAARALGDVLHDPDALRTIAEAGDAWRASGAGLSLSLDDVAGMLGRLDWLLEREAVDDELAGRFGWEVGWSAAAMTTTYAVRVLVPGGPLRSIASSGARTALDQLRTRAEQSGWWSSPRSPSTVIADAATRHDMQRAIYAAAVASSVFDALRSAGGIEAGVTAPPPAPVSPPDGDGCVSNAWRDQFEEWLSSNPGVGADARLVIHDAVSTVLNPYQAAEACADLRQ